jgi:phospholipid-binding lipoprotein MlaA
MLDTQIHRIVKILVMFSLIGQQMACQRPGSVDRLECFNRPMYYFNKSADKIAFKPVARIYHALIPQPVQRMVGNFFQNLSEIPNAANDFLQGNFSYVRADLSRFIVNSTWGIGGLLDVAAKGGLPARRQDFGLTLAKWGYKDSTYIVLPILGPSTIRDGIGKVGTYYMGIPAHLKSVRWRNRLLLINFIDVRASLLKIEPALNEAVDEYIFVRDAYFQHRQSEIDNSSAGTTRAEANSQPIELAGPPE